MRTLLPLTFLLLLAPALARGQGARYRSNTIDPRARRVAADIQRGVLADPQRYLEPLVKALTAGVDDDFLKVKILHDWVADNIAYDAKSYLAGTSVESDWQTTLASGKGVCQGYSKLLAEMCRLAAVPCEKISGYGRGYLFGMGAADSPNQVNHAWNAVQIGGRWYLVDVTWDAGQVKQGAFHKAYGTTYLFPQPRQFVYTHFPSEPKWQLLDPPLAAEQFVRLPYLRGTFFEHGLQLLSPLGRVTRAGKSVQFSLQLPDDVLLSTQLKPPQGAELPWRTLLQREADQCKVLATFPRAGRWKVQVFAKRRGDPGSLSLAASLEFDSSGGTARTFPKTYTTYGELDGSLYSPLYLPLAVGKPLPFRVRLRGAEEVYLTIGGRRWERLLPNRSEKEIYELTTTVPSGVPVRLALKKPGGDSYATFIDFTPDL